MLKRSTLLLGTGLVVASAVLAGLWQVKGPRLPLATSKAAAPALRGPTEPSTDKGQGTVRSVYPGLVAGNAPPQRDVGERTPATSNAPRPAPPPAPPEAGTSPGPTPPAQAALPEPDAGAGTPVAGGASPEAGSVDLNTGSVEDLNRLGAGMIGRRIVGGRPMRARTIW